MLANTYMYNQQVYTLRLFLQKRERTDIPSHFVYTVMLANTCMYNQQVYALRLFLQKRESEN